MVVRNVSFNLKNGTLTGTVFDREDRGPKDAEAVAMIYGGEIYLVPSAGVPAGKQAFDGGTAYSLVGDMMFGPRSRITTQSPNTAAIAAWGMASSIDGHTEYQRQLLRELAGEYEKRRREGVPKIIEV